MSIRDEIDEIVKNDFYREYSGELNHNHLCRVFSETDWQYLWDFYWVLNNDMDYTYLTNYFPNPYEAVLEEKVLLRLLIVEDFKNYCEGL